MKDKDLRKRIEQVRNSAHCRNCGKINPEMVEDGDMPHAYTKCCNEALCDRLMEYIFGNNQVSVQACCWAVAELEFIARGIDVAKQKGMNRLR